MKEGTPSCDNKVQASVATSEAENAETQRAWLGGDVANGELTPDDQSVSDETIQQYERENGFYVDNQYDADDEEDTFSEHEHDMLLEKYHFIFDVKPPFQLKNVMITETSYLGDSDTVAGETKCIDVDVMFILDNIAITIEEQNNVALEVNEDFPGFIHVQVKKDMVSLWKDYVVYLIDDEKNNFYLSSVKLQKRLFDKCCQESSSPLLDQDSLTSFISSHAGFKMPAETQEARADLVLCIPCEGWPSVAEGWFDRRRQWPPRRSLDRLRRVGYHLTAKPLPADHDSDGILFRISTAHVEKELMRMLNDKQLAIYQCLKSVIRKICDENVGVRLALHPYYLKTVTLWACEKHKLNYWQDTPAAVCVLHLLEDTLNCLLKGFCPNYFMPQYNLYSHVDRQCRHDAAREIQRFRQQPQILRECLSSFGFLDKDIDEMLELHRPQGTLRLSEFLLSLDPLLIIDSSSNTSEITTESTERLDEIAAEKPHTLDELLGDQQPADLMAALLEKTESLKKQYERPPPPSPPPQMISSTKEASRPLSSFSLRSYQSQTGSVATRDEWAMIYKTFNPYKTNPIKLYRPKATSRLFQPPTKSEVLRRLRKELHRNTTVVLGRKPSKYESSSLPVDATYSRTYDLQQSNPFDTVDNKLEESTSTLQSFTLDATRGRYSRLSAASAPDTTTRIDRINPLTGKVMFPTLRPRSAPAKTRWSRVLIGQQQHSINRSVTFIAERPVSSLDYGFSLDRLAQNDW
ncbi:uncharacterized protein [Ptychodera flava]|uniref:uncharacterized protein n=1 Tax=Ptychodera flava TaxID=63121 RepID=UPI00396A1F84